MAENVKELTGLEKTNADRASAINSMYDANLASQKSNLESSYNRNLANAQADREKIGTSYQEKNNSLGADYERNRRNNNIKAVSNGLNTGASSQMDLASANMYQQGRSKLAASQAEEEAAADRNILNIKSTYESDVNKAIADNDAQRAAALLDEYQQAYDRSNQAAKAMADKGDFSGYALLFGKDTADNMQQTWAMQNPEIAWTQGKLTAEQYQKLTGKWPNGYSSGGGAAGGGGYSGGGGSYTGPAKYWVNGGWSSSPGGSSSSQSDSGSPSSPSRTPEITPTAINTYDRRDYK